MFCEGMRVSTFKEKTYLFHHDKQKKALKIKVSIVGNTNVIPLFSPKNSSLQPSKLQKQKSPWKSNIFNVLQVPFSTPKSGIQPRITAASSFSAKIFIKSW